MIIKAIRFREDGFATQPFAFGGEEGPDKFDPSVRYRSGLTNYLIDTGDEVILVDTGIPSGTPEEVPDETTAIYTGKDISSYMEAFAALGYRPEQVTRILLTHKHNDHSGELKSFPNARIYVNKDELEADELRGIDNIVPVEFTDGAYYNFPACQKILDGVYFIKAKGHTKGNSIVVVEDDGLYYMLHGDITYTMRPSMKTSSPWCLRISPPPERQWIVYVSLSPTIRRCIFPPIRLSDMRTLKTKRSSI